MRLLHVVPTYAPALRYGGPIRSVHGLCKALARRGHEVLVATTNVDGDGESDVPTDRPVDVDGVSVLYFPSTFLRRIYYSPRMRAFLRRAVPDADVVHLHSVFLWPTSAAAAIARRAGVPYVLSPRGMLVQELVRRRSTSAKRAWIALLESRNLRHAAAIHTTSTTETNELCKFGFPLPSIIEIPNGVDTRLTTDDEGCNAMLPELPSRYIMFLGRISWKKGLERLIESLAQTPSTFLLIAGNDDERYGPRLQQLASRLGVLERVRFAGFVDGALKGHLLRNALAIVLPSDSENFGISLLEAMAAGTPVVATPGVGLASTIEEQRCGLIVEGSPSSLAQAFERLAQDPRLCSEFGRNGLIASKCFSWEFIAERFEKHYLEARGKAQPSP